jgi:hypothetical protein
MTAVPDPNNPGFLIPQYGPVYAQPVSPTCTFLSVPGLPCAVGGNIAFGYSPTTIPSTQLIFWGDENHAASCLTPPFDCELPLEFPVLRVNFSVPTDYATAVVGYFDDDSNILGGFQAFDGGGQPVARCEGQPGEPLTSNPPGCASVVLSSGGIGWAQLTISRPTADIGFILVGALSNIRPIAQVQFHSPVSVQLAGLLKKVQGVGASKSLAHKVMFAETYYEVHDIPAACAQLTAFEHEVKAQTDKHIGDLTALQLLSTSTAIGDALSCREPEGHGPQPWD